VILTGEMEGLVENQLKVLTALAQRIIDR